MKGFCVVSIGLLEPALPCRENSHASQDCVVQL